MTAILPSLSPVNRNALSARAVVVTLSISSWRGQAIDEAAAGAVAEDFDARPDSGTYRKDLVGKALHPVGAAATQLRRAHRALTLPWLDGGMRVLPVSQLMEYRTQIDSLEETFRVAVREFIAGYESAKETARHELGKLFDESDYPSVSEIRDRFDVRRGTLPVPDARDFRVAATGDELATMQAEAERTIQEVLRNATLDLWRRMSESVKPLVERLRSADAPLKTALFSNLRRTCDAVGKLNLAEDPEVDAARDRLIKFLDSINVDLCRDDETERSASADAVSAILADIDARLGAR